MIRLLRWIFLLSVVLAGFALPTQAQTQCGIARSISFPIDTSQFQIVQDFGAPSPRYQGRYHTGEDWYGGRGTSYGTYVRAIADGQVTFSSPNGWGRDGGVIIIQHSFPDGSTAYSMYGHVTDATGVTFPAVYTCVHQGDVIAAVGAPRPAPHLHFEIRVNQPDVPGPGYTWEDPVQDGYRRPSKFVLNWQAWFSPSYRWRTDIADEAGPVAPPVELADHSLILIDGGRVLRVSPDGRVLWRVNLDAPAVGLVSQQNNIILAYASGKMQTVNPDGTLGDSWQSGVALDSAPIPFGGLLVFHTASGGLVAFDATLRATVWQASGVAAVVRAQVSEQALGLMTADNAMLTVSPQGQLLDRALLREPGSLAADGGLIAYTRGGLWRVDNTGAWSLALTSVPPGGRSSAVASADGRLFLFDGAALEAYDASGASLWQTALPGVGGTVSLSVANGIVLLTSSEGSIIAVQESAGGVCNALRIYGSTRSREWHSLGDDGVLRVYVADQIIGLNWKKFLMACG